MHTQETIQEIGNYESSLDTVACELLQYVSPETKELYYAFSKALQSDLRSEFGNVFENFPVAQKTKKEILEEAFEYYAADPSRRATNAEGSCRYLMEDGRKCAVGRCLIEGKKIRIGSMQKDPIFAEIQANQISNLDSHLLPEYRGHSVDFWQELQYWHDCCLNFTETGLSKKGEQQAEFLLTNYANN